MKSNLVGRAVTVGLAVLLCCTCALSNVPTDVYGRETIEGGLYHGGQCLLSGSEQVSLPKANATIILKDRIAGTTVNGTVGFNFTSGSNGIDIGFVQYFLSVINGNDTVPVSGLNFTERDAHLFAFAGSNAIINDTTSSYSTATVSGRTLPRWSINTMGAFYEGPLDYWGIQQLTEVGFILQYHNLTICFANDAYRTLGIRVATIGLSFTRIDDNWSHSLIIDMPGAAGLTVNGSVVTAYMDGLVPIDPNWNSSPMVPLGEEFIILSSISVVIVVMAIVGIVVLQRRHHTVPL